MLINEIRKTLVSYKLDLRSVTWTLFCTFTVVLPTIFMLKALGVFILISCYSALTYAQNDSRVSGTARINSNEKAINFAAVYATQWAYYLTAHKDEIKKYGSFENWLENPINPHYDRDSFEFNIIRHSIAGQYYYLFYRSRNYTEQNAFIWSVISSFAFEFTIETVTERPSYQDLYQTPVFGTVLGVGVEKLSIFLHDTDTWIGDLAGYLLNPFPLLPPTNKIFGYVIPEQNKVSLMLRWEFE